MRTICLVILNVNWWCIGGVLTCINISLKSQQKMVRKQISKCNPQKTATWAEETNHSFICTQYYWVCMLVVSLFKIQIKSYPSAHHDRSEYWAEYNVYGDTVGGEHPSPQNKAHRAQWSQKQKVCLNIIITFFTRCCCCCCSRWMSCCKMKISQPIKWEPPQSAKENCNSEVCW